MSQKEQQIGTTHDFTDGEMKQVSVNGAEILVARVNGKYHAVGAFCTHYGAPLVDGVLNGERLVCPWHHACFNVTTGELEEPPALDDLPCYEVRVENEQIIARLPEEMSDRRTPSMSKRDVNDERLFVIVGGGAAGYAAAQTLREDGFKGRVLLLTRENHLPYDRPNLSKEYLQGTAEPAWLPLRPEVFFNDNDIQVMHGKEVTLIDAAQKTITFVDGETLHCDALLIATGGEPRKLPFQSEEHENVFSLRSYADSTAIAAAAEKGKRAVVIGTSFIGMEVASSLAQRGCEVTVIGLDKVPFEKILGPEIGKLFQDLHEANGVKFKLGASIAEFVGAKTITAVTLEGGERVEADFVIIGVGVKPATDFLKGIELHKDGGVIVDQHMCAASGVYAAGDIAYYPSPQTHERQRIEHWRTALQQGRIAAHNMAGKKIAYDGVPFFWTRQFDVSLSYVGHGAGWDELIFQGDLAAHSFLAFYLKSERVVAIAGMNRDQEMAAAEEIMRLGEIPGAEQIRSGDLKILQLMHPGSSPHPRPLAHTN